MSAIAILQGQEWCPVCPGGWGMVVMVIFWALVLILLALAGWFFYRILTGGSRQRHRPRGTGGSASDGGMGPDGGPGSGGGQGPGGPEDAT